MEFSAGYYSDTATRSSSAVVQAATAVTVDPPEQENATKDRKQEDVRGMRNSTADTGRSLDLHF